jgi:CRP/FNR family cyclic AMP-dependent transcriptional regulator
MNCWRVNINYVYLRRIMRGCRNQILDVRGLLPQGDRMSNSDTQPFPDHRSCRSLTGITVQHLPRDGSLGRVRRYSEGKDIWQPADAADRIYFLQRGQVAITARDAEGREFTMRVVEAGDPFGELCFCSVTDTRRHSFSRALVDSRVVEITHEDLYTFLQKDHQALVALTYTFCVRLSAAEDRVDALMHRDAEGRLGRVLVSLATARGTDPNATQVVFPVKHNELAKMAAMDRSHVTVTMGKFRQKGLVDYQRGKPLIVNIQKLMVYLQIYYPK